MKFGECGIEEASSRDECSWIIGMTESGMNITMLLFIFILIKQMLSEQSIVSGKQGWLEIARDWTDRQKPTPLDKTLIHITSRREKFLPENSLSWMSRNCLWYVRIRRNRPELFPMHVQKDQNIDILTFSSHFYDIHFVNSSEMKSCNDGCQHWYWIWL